MVKPSSIHTDEFLKQLAEFSKKLHNAIKALCDGIRELCNRLTKDIVDGHLVHKNKPSYRKTLSKKQQRW